MLLGCGTRVKSINTTVDTRRAITESGKGWERVVGEGRGRGWEKVGEGRGYDGTVSWVSRDMGEEWEKV